MVNITRKRYFTFALLSLSLSLFYLGCEEGTTTNTVVEEDSLESYESLDEFPECNEERKNRSFFSKSDKIIYVCDGAEFIATQEKLTTSGEEEVTQDSQKSNQVFDTVADFPVCDESSKDNMVFARDQGKAFVCSGSDWISSVGTTEKFLEENGESTTTEKEAVSLACEGAIDTKPPAPVSSGQLSFDIPSTVDPCNVSGYVVGSQGTSDLQVTKDGQFFFDKVPPGENDIVVTAGSLVLGLNAAAQDRGLRINGVQANFGLTTKLGEVNLPKLGTISGKVTLNAQNITDYAGIKIYIPGTSFDATSGTDGTYSMTSVPPGVHNLYFEKDGYGRGQLENITVAPEENTAVLDMKLSLDTGETGTFSYANSLLSSTNKLFIAGNSIDFNVLPSDKAVLMLLRQEGTESIWRPVNTNYKTDINMQSLLMYKKSISRAEDITDSDFLASPIQTKFFGKFANENGLESDIVERELFVDYFSGGTEPFVPSFSFTKETIADNGMRLTLNGITHPANADKMRIEFSSPSGLSSVPTASGEFVDLFESHTWEFAHSPKYCGTYSATLNYSGSNGHVRTSFASYPASNLLMPSGDSSHLISITNECSTAIAADYTIQSATTNTNTSKYKMVWTGTEAFILGFDDSNNLTAGKYNPSSKTWSTAPTTGANSADVPAYDEVDLMVKVGNYVLVVNEPSGGSGVKYFLYDIAGNAWLDSTTFPTMANADTYFYPGYSDDYFVVFYRETVADRLYRIKFNGTNGTWATAAQASNTLNGVSRTNPLGDKILLTSASAVDSSDLSSKTYWYDPSDDSITEKNDLPGGVTIPTYGPIEFKFGKLYFLEPGNGKIYDPSDESWVVISIATGGVLNDRSVVIADGVVVSPPINLQFYGNYGTMGYMTLDGANYVGNQVALGATIPGFRMMAASGFMPGYGFLLWGGYQFINSSTISMSDGLVVETSFSNMWDE